MLTFAHADFIYISSLYYLMKILSLVLDTRIKFRISNSLYY